MSDLRVAGVLYVRVDGTLYNSTGNFTYNLGSPKREAMMSTHGVTGYSETPQVPFIEGEITDSGSLDVAELQRISGATMTLELANGKTVTLRDAWYAAEGNIGTEKSNIQVRFEGKSMTEGK